MWLFPALAPALPSVCSPRSQPHSSRVYSLLGICHGAAEGAGLCGLEGSPTHSGSPEQHLGCQSSLGGARSQAEICTNAAEH